MLSKVTIVLVLLTRTLSTQICDKNEAVDISKGIHLNGIIYHQDIAYKQNEYFIDETGKEMGCICLKKKCIAKCCPFGQGYNNKKKVCVNIEDDFDPPVWDKFKVLDKKANDTFHFTFGKKNCSEQETRIVISNAFAKFHIVEDGQLLVEVRNVIPPWKLRGPDKYCVDTFVTKDPSTGVLTPRLDALVCFAGEEDKGRFVPSSICMLISCVFILATVAVYGWLPELRNLHGRVLMVYLLCLCMGFAALATMQIMLMVDNIYAITCFSLTIVIYFSLESAFFWLNVMCFDIWWTFSGKRGISNRLSSTKARFLAYCVYAFGIPTLLTILLVSLELSGLPPHPLMPMLRQLGCFIYGNSKLLYLYGPMLLVCISNIVFFVLTALKINEIKKQTSVLKAKDNSTHDPHSKDKQRLTLYMKLFMVMGINWTLEVVSAVYPDVPVLWNFTDAYNVLIGFIIFILFVCKRKIFKLIKKRIKGKLTNTSNDDIGELKEINNGRRQQMINQRASQETIRTSIGSVNNIRK